MQGNKTRISKQTLLIALFYLFGVLASHYRPFLTFLISLLALVIIIIFFKNNRLKNHLIFFLLVYWPCCFYTYLHLFVQSVIDENILLGTYESPIYIKMDFESVVFWVARFAIIHTIKLKLPLLNLIKYCFFSTISF